MKIIFKREREKDRKYSGRVDESEKFREKCETLHCMEGERASFFRRFPGFSSSSF
jgi:hypothetical protein